jgi:hypothetical protein
MVLKFNKSEQVPKIEGFYLIAVIINSSSSNKR